MGLSQDGIFYVSILIALCMAWGIGANDTANALGTSVGSGALGIRGAIIIGAICEFSGAVLLGGGVASTVAKGIVDP
ncbi:phosphate transporter, partial [Kipferlia bialata]|eukprot:g7173.t1